MMRLVRPGEEVIVPSQEVIDEIHKGSVIYVPALSRFEENGIFGQVIPFGQFGIHIN